MLITHNETAKEAWEKWANLTKEKIADSYDREGSYSGEYLRKVLGDIDTFSNGWAGDTASVSREIAAGVFDTSDFERARRNGSFSNLMAELGFFAPKRNRVYSEYDGEWDYGRRFDVAPFASTKKMNNGIVPIVNIRAHFNFRGNATPNDIRQYGILCWSLVDALEMSGTRVKVEVCSGTTGLGRKNGKSVDSECSWLIKDADEYGDSLSIARCFTPTFLRRIIYAREAMIATEHNALVNHGLGSPAKGECKATPGVIMLYPDALEWSVETLRNFIEGAIK